uniref:Innexin n=1 Tax=Globodera pallida TaxID=36090 RepID=A0A183BRI5_GLOPA
MSLISAFNGILPNFQNAFPLFLVFLFPFLHGACADIDLSTQAGSKACVGKLCDDSSVFHYYECCGQLYNGIYILGYLIEVEFSWVIIVFAVLAVCMIASLLLCLIKCICCCEEIRQWDEMRPLELVWNVQEMIELLQGKHTLSMQRSDKMWLAIDITSHFLRKDDPAELFDCITTIRDPTKLCPLWAFVSAILSRLSADFVTIRGSQKWHSEVAHALMNLDAEFSDVALTKRDINQQNKYCAKWHGFVRHWIL